MPILKLECQKLLENWEKLEKKGLNIDAETAQTGDVESVSPAYAAVSALERSLRGQNMHQQDGLQTALKAKQEKEQRGTFNTPTYWTLWQELIN